MPDKKKSEFEKAIQAVEKNAAEIAPEAKKAAAAARQQTAEISPEAIEAAQAAQEVQKAIVVDTPDKDNLRDITPEDVSKATQGAQAQLDNIGVILQDVLQSVAVSFKSINMIYESAAESIKQIAETLNAIFKTDEWKQIEKLFPGITTDDFFDALVILGAEYDPEGTPTIDAYIELFNELTRILPYIPDVLEAYKKESSLQEVSFIQFLRAADPATGEPAESLFSKCRTIAAGPDREPPILKAIVPDNYLIPNSIVNNSLAKGLVNAGPVKIDPSQGHKGKYHIYAAITLDPNEYAVNGSFTKYDRRVFNGYCSLIAAGNKAFTAEMVYRAMNGLSNAEKVTPQQVAAVTKSLDKQRNIDVSIDATEEFSKRKIIDPNNTKAKVMFEAKCLEARKITVSAGGKEKSAYMPIAKPVLYDYSEKLNQIISVSSDLLVIKDETGGRISNTDNFSAIREYLLQRIEEMKSRKRRGQKVNPVIDINTFYEETDTNTTNTKYTTKARKQAAQCLDYWIKSGYIRNYKMVKKKKAISAIEIVL